MKAMIDDPSLAKFYSDAAEAYKCAVEAAKYCAQCDRRFLFFESKVYITAGVRVHAWCLAQFTRKLYEVARSPKWEGEPCPCCGSRSTVWLTASGPNDQAGWNCDRCKRWWAPPAKGVSRDP